MIGQRYSLEREIGRGGMGAVWLGRDEVLGRAVALKRVGVAPGASSPDQVRAEREARIAASLNHPHIVGVFDFVEDGEQQYLVMEYVDGVPLSDLIREEGPLPRERAARLLAEVADALGAAHASHVVHRDVKPSNILVSHDGSAKLSDFGIARSETDASLTQTGLVTGSPAYLAPEVARGQQATPASDVWSLGATLFHALSGRPPYEVRDNVLGTLYQIVNEQPPRLDDAGDLSPVLLATMAHDPRRRWSADDVARVLELITDSTASASSAPDPSSATEWRPAREAVLVPAAPSSATSAAGAPPSEPVVGSDEPGAAPWFAGADEPTSGRRRQTLPLVVGGLVVALLVVIAALLLQDDPQPEPTVGTDGARGSTGANGPATSPTSPTDPSSSPQSPTTSPTEDAVTEAQLRSFVEDYLQTAAADPAAGFARLTPGFAGASGGLEGYESFWGSVTNPRLQSFDADVDDLTVAYTYRYRRPPTGLVTESVELRLERSGEGFLIAGEA